MNENARDTQFAGFSRLLWDEVRNLQRRQFNSLNDGLVHLSTEWDEETARLIAQRAYDFACHIATHTVLTAHGDMSKIPDMTTLPEVKSE